MNTASRLGFEYAPSRQEEAPGSCFHFFLSRYQVKNRFGWLLMVFPTRAQNRSCITAGIRTIIRKYSPRPGQSRTLPITLLHVLHERIASALSGAWMKSNVRCWDLVSVFKVCGARRAQLLSLSQRIRNLVCGKGYSLYFGPATSSKSDTLRENIELEV